MIPFTQEEIDHGRVCGLAETLTKLGVLTRTMALDVSIKVWARRLERAWGPWQ
jgi:hypothetical protein